MNIKFSSGDKGSSASLVKYLEKENKGRSVENKEYFFSDSEDQILTSDVIKSIDYNKKGLGKDDSKFFMITINPSSKELKHIGNDANKLKNYTRKVMDEYAKNFNREGINNGSQLLYFGKLERNRYHRKSHKKKEGLNTHIHIIVSRRDKDQRLKLSPMSNAKKKYKTSNSIASAGFDRNTMREKTELTFDKEFNYNRAYTDSFKYQNTIKNGSIEEQDLVLRKANMKEIDNNRSKEKYQGIGY